MTFFGTSWRQLFDRKPGWIELYSLRKLLSPSAARGLTALAMTSAVFALAHAQTLENAVQQLPSGQLQFTVTETPPPPVTPPPQYVLQSSPTLSPAVWTSITGSSFTSLAGQPTTFALALTPPAAAVQFYRVIKLTDMTVDPNSDWATHVIEAILSGHDPDSGSAPDAIAYAYGIRNVPILTTLPRAEFVDAVSYATEGPGAHLVNVRFDKPFFGKLNYAVLPESTARASVDFQALSGSVDVAGTNAAISLNWLDDTNVSPSRLVFLQITNSPSDPYARGGQTRHTIVLLENDAWWHGILKGKYAERNFRGKLLHGTTGTQFIFAAGAGQDGLPTLASESLDAQSSQSEGVVPAGVWPGTVQFASPIHFQVSSPPVPASSGGLFGVGTGLTRTLVLEASPSNDAVNFHKITPNQYIGSYTEVLALPGISYLGCTNTGVFVLVQDLPTSPNVSQ